MQAKSSFFFHLDFRKQKRFLATPKMTTTKNRTTTPLGLLLVAILANTLLVGVDSLVLPTQQQQQQPCRGIQRNQRRRPQLLLKPLSLPTTISQQRNEKQCSSALYSFTESTSPPEDPSIAVNGANGSSKTSEDGDDDGDATTAISISTATATTTQTRKLERFRKSLPFQNDTLDGLILKTCVPTVMNLMVVPLVNSVDTFWVGRLGVAMALAAQSAANQACFTLFFMIAFLPNMTAPLVASAVSSGDEEQARERICESLFLCNVLGAMGTFALMVFPRQILTALLLPAGSPVLDYAAPYLRWRALGMVPSLIAATGSAAYRGLLNTVTPLKVSLMTNGVNLVLDPLLMFGTRGLGGVGSFKGLGFVGAAVATAVAEILGGATYIRLLLRRKLARWSMLLKPPPLKSLLPLLSGGAAMLLRQLALNIGFLVATRRAQVLDASGVSGAAYGITMQIYSIGIITLVGMQNAAAALVPSFRGAKDVNDPSKRDQNARDAADRLFGWSTLVGLGLGIGQVALLPVLVPIFSTLPEVREAVKMPSLIAALIHVVNGPVLAGEGIMMGVGAYKELAIVTMGYIATMVGCLCFTPLGQRLDGIMWSILFSSIVQQIGVIVHYLKFGPLAIKKLKKKLRNDNEVEVATTSVPL
jgi:MATE family multidrug resistance protein